MLLGDLVSAIQALGNRLVLLEAVFGALSLAGTWLVVRYRRKRGWNPNRILDDHFKVRQPHLSRQALRELVQGNSVTLGQVLNAGWFNKQPLIVPESARCLNALTLAPVGAGKTSFLLSTYLDQDMSRPQVCLIVFDGQKALTEEVLALAAHHQREVVLYPDAGFNPLRGPGSPEANAALFGEVWAQVEDIPSAGPARYYAGRAQSFIRKVVPLYERAYHQPMLLCELFELCLSDTLRERLLTDGTGTPEARAYRLLFDGWSKSHYETSLSGLVNFLDRLLIERNAWLYNQRWAPTLLECIERKQVVVIREGGASGTQQHARGLLYMVLLQEYAERRKVTPTSPLISLFMDEAHMYFNRNYPTFLATARKKLIAQQLGFQSLKQLVPYEPIITTNCRTWILHGGLEHADALVVANNIGKRRFTEKSWSSTGWREARQTHSQTWDYLVQPHEIRGLSQERALVLTVEGGKREVAAHAFIKKPPLLRLQTVVPYEEPPVPTTPPPTIWEERDHQQSNAAGQQGAAPAMPGSPPLPARQPTPDW